MIRSSIESNPLDFFILDEDNLLLTEDGEVPLIHWPQTPNFGDVLSPWLFNKLTQRKILQNDGSIPSYIAVGSILSFVRKDSIVWGTGSFGPEPPRQVNRNAKYLAVRGPLTRSLIISRKTECPRVYGDPALLSPYVYNPKIEKTHEVGVVLRWSEDKWLKKSYGKGVKLIDLGTDDVEGVIDQMLSCKRIITSSLHGLIIADSYGIPNAWLSSRTPYGHEFKFFDYFLSVGKVRNATEFDILSNELEVEALDSAFDFDDRKLSYDPLPLLDACPFLKRK